VASSDCGQSLFHVRRVPFGFLEMFREGCTHLWLALGIDNMLFEGRDDANLHRVGVAKPLNKLFTFGHTPLSLEAEERMFADIKRFIDYPRIRGPGAGAGREQGG
jgi:hypothetical protein